MKTFKHNKTLSVQDVDILSTSQKQQHKRHGDLLPSSIRCLIAGPSGCGKTNAMLSLVYDLNGLCFENIYVYSKSLYQPKYQTLEKILQGVKTIKYFPYNENTEILPPSDAQPNSIFIFDDIVCDNHDKVREYFSMGRHNNIDSFYLCQTYSKAPKQLLRDNCNMLVIFRQDDLNLEHIYKNHVGGDMSFNIFKKISACCWNSDTYGFITICKDFDLNNGRYRRGFDRYISISDSDTFQ